MIIVLFIIGMILVGGGALAGSLLVTASGLFMLVAGIIAQGVIWARHPRASRRSRKGEFETFHVDKPPGGNWWRIP